jgi:cell fate regulator YaaT (PSP1 superfamily)
MKLVSAQYTFDNSKLLFYFTSDGRVDFRELVKDLAGVFHIRIELRQIGIRDETRMIGGLGSCGRPLCCTTFLSDFGQVSMKMAKEQNLSLNSTKISGCCGRLMCCLRFEYDTYAEAIKKLPSSGTLVETPDGAGVVTDILPLANSVKVSLKDHPEASSRVYERDAITVIGRPQSNDRSKNTTSKQASNAPTATPNNGNTQEQDISEPDSDM